ncbi:universal stress protein [Geminicoccaceae bacterium 1502E]|nr:universal stress protein [Geminicoccaceae bacterium 1502E]
MIRRILVGVSGTPGLADKLAYVVELAARHRAEIGALSIVEVERLADLQPSPLGGSDAGDLAAAERIRQSSDNAEQTLRELERLGPQHGVAVTRLERRGDPLDELLRACRYHDLLVLSLRGWFEEGVLEEPENALLKLLASGVRPILGLAATQSPIGKVMIAYNGSVESARAMKLYAQLRLWGEVPVDLVCAEEGEGMESCATLLDDASAYLRAHGLDCTTACLPEATPETLLAHAQAVGADLVVMGGSYRRVLLSQRCGPHTLGVFRSTPLPVLFAH